MKQEEMEMQLWEYIDGSCSDADSLRIAQLIANDAAWNERFNELSTLHTSIADSIELEQPSMRFAKNVMDAVASIHQVKATKQYINRGVIRGIAAFFIVMMVSILGYALASVNWNAATPGYYSKLNTINFSSLFNGPVFNAVVCVNIVLLLVLADVMVRGKSESLHKINLLP